MNTLYCSLFSDDLVVLHFITGQNYQSTALEYLRCYLYVRGDLLWSVDTYIFSQVMLPRNIYRIGYINIKTNIQYVVVDCHLQSFSFNHNWFKIVKCFCFAFKTENNAIHPSCKWCDLWLFFILTHSARGSHLDVRIWRLYRRQILTSKVDRGNDRVIYNDRINHYLGIQMRRKEKFMIFLKLKNPFGLYGLYNNISALYGLIYLAVDIILYSCCWWRYNFKMAILDLVNHW